MVATVTLDKNLLSDYVSNGFLCSHLEHCEKIVLLFTQELKTELQKAKQVHPACKKLLIENLPTNEDITSGVFDVHYISYFKNEIKAKLTQFVKAELQCVDTHYDPDFGEMYITLSKNDSS